MKQENKALIIKYTVCFCVASLITLFVFWNRGFFTEDVGVNIQILSDGFFVPGILFLFLAGMMFISGEGGLLGIGFVMRNVILTFIPMGRKHHETYAQYRERKLGERKKMSDHALLVTGLVFALTGLVFTVIWYTNFYTPV